MHFYKTGKLRRGAPENPGERLTNLESLVKLRANKIHQIRLTGDEGIIGIDTAAHGSRVVSQAGREAAGGRSAKRPKLNHRSFARIYVPSKLI